MTKRISKKLISSIMSVVTIVIIVSVFIIVFFYKQDDDLELSGWSLQVYNTMTLYLFFIIFRSVLLIIFSFFSKLSQVQPHKLKTYPLVSIIIPCHNEEAVIKHAIESILVLDYPNYEVIVIDDGSKDSTLEEAKKMDKRGRIRTLYQENTGKAGALNRGISEAHGEYVLCMDADSILNKDVLIYGINEFLKNSRLAGIAGSVMVGNNNQLLGKFQYLEYIIGLNFHKMAQKYFKMVTIVPGPIGLFKKKCLLEVGGYHTDTFAEDCDLSVRLLMRGYDIDYCEQMNAVTEAPEHLQQLISQRYRWARGIVQAIMKHSFILFKPTTNIRSFGIVIYMYTENIFIPVLNFLFAVATIEHALLYKNTLLFGPYFVSLLILDVALTLYCTVFIKGSFSLTFLSMFSKFTYGLMLEVVRFLAILDEILKLPMNWGAQIRKGLK